MSTPLNVRHLLMRRSPTFALDVQQLALKKGTILCVTGPNGSGKTTLLSCLVGLLKPDGGTVSVLGHVLGHDLKLVRRYIGYVPDDDEWFIKELSAREYFDLLAKVYETAGVTGDTKARTQELAHRLQFTAFDQQLEQLSHGNKKKVQIIAGLMHSPAVIVLDELRNGLDPLAIIAAEKLVQAEAKRGACIVAATHDLWWAERIAHEVMLLMEGRVAIHDSKRRLVKTFGSLEALFLETVSIA